MMRSDAASAGVQLKDGLPSRRPTRIVTYAWGEKYIGDLLSMTLPALLAPGNLPYVASVLACEVVILSEEGAFPRILADPVVRRIRELCPLRLIGLDDLIPAPDKYGMALTYVLHRGFSDLGPAVTDTWLLFLNADFILADGSLRTLVRRLAEGRDFVLSPSYCVNADAVGPGLLERIDPDSKALSIAPREMAALVLRHRHNTIRGKTVNQPMFSARHMDQFYWLVDKDTLIGHQMPIAVVGMRPERHMAEPNSYWDHGLMRELMPTAEPCVIGDSDEFLMLELRDKQVAHDEFRAGWPTPHEIARNTIWFLTPYQKDMARHQLTLHAGELPSSIDGARAELRAFVDSVLAHVPPVLPSHIGHPQWTYHWPGFVAARHKYLSTRLDSLTETEAPPESLSEIDKAWWKLDGLTKSHARRRAELVSLMERQRATVEALLARIDDLRWSEIGERLARDLDAIAPARAPRNGGVAGHRTVEWDPDQSDPVVLQSPAGEEDPWVAPLVASSEAWIAGQPEVQDKRRLLMRALEFAERHCKDRLLLLDAELEPARKSLQSDYERLLNRHLASDAVPQVIAAQGSQTSAAPSGNVLIRMARRIYRGAYGRVPHVRLLHPYWASMRHLIRLVNRASESGARNVLVVVGSEPLADTIADHLPGLHARVSLLEVIGGNLDQAFSEHPQFDLCICSMGVVDLPRFAKVVKAVTPCMRKGGKVVGFHPNFDLNQNAVHSFGMPESLFDNASSGRIYYAGSEASARIIRLARHADPQRKRGIFGLARVAMRLLSTTRRAVAANLWEASIPEDRWSKLPENCTSITIEVTV